MFKKVWKILKTGWMKFAHVLGVINTTILLTIIYFVVVGIYSLISRIFRLIAHLFRKKTESYWIKRDDNLDTQSCKYPF